MIPKLTPRIIAALILVAAIGAIGAAWFYESLGYLPCELCYKERIPYYAAFALAPAAGLAAQFDMVRLARGLFIVLALLFVGNAALSVYHALVELKLVAGPSDCSGALSSATTMDEFLKQLQTTKVVRCDEPNLWIFGLTMADWNVALSAALAGLALFAGFARAEPTRAPGDPPAYQALFDRSFEPGFHASANDAGEGERPQLVKTGFRIVELGRVSIRSGRIAASDPFVMIDRPAFAQPVANGEHRVRLAVVDGGMADGRIAFARVDFSAGPVLFWRMATLDGQELARLKAEEFYGYPVDAGTGAFFDPLAGKAAAALLQQDQNAWQAWQRDGEENGRKAGLKPNFFLNLPMPPANIAMFASGWGDGHYASWFGFAEDGRVAALVTDFTVADWR